eukprot:4517166-Amphidinium_carterae.1
MASSSSHCFTATRNPLLLSGVKDAVAPERVHAQRTATTWPHLRRIFPCTGGFWPQFSARSDMQSGRAERAMAWVEFKILSSRKLLQPANVTNRDRLCERKYLQEPNISKSAASRKHVVSCALLQTQGENKGNELHV